MQRHGIKGHGEVIELLTSGLRVKRLSFCSAFSDSESAEINKSSQAWKVLH